MSLCASHACVMDPSVFVIFLPQITDRWRSTLHRVVVKPPGARRQSIAYFCNVNGDCIVDPRDLFVNNKNKNKNTDHGEEEQQQHQPLYPPITAMEHLMSKHLASMGHASTSTEEKQG